MQGYRFRGREARRARERTGLTATDLAARVQVTPQFISQIERGADEPGAALYLRICNALGVDPDSLREPRDPDPTHPAPAEPAA